MPNFECRDDDSRPSGWRGHSQHYNSEADYYAKNPHRFDAPDGDFRGNPGPGGSADEWRNWKMTPNGPQFDVAVLFDEIPDP